MDRSILKTGIPAGIVVSVLAFSMLFPAVVSKGNHGNDDGYGDKCGYGQGQDNDENDNNDRGAGGDIAKETLQRVSASAVPQSGKDRHDNDCNEDEGNGGEGGGGQ